MAASDVGWKNCPNLAGGMGLWRWARAPRIRELNKVGLLCRLETAGVDRSSFRHPKTSPSGATGDAMPGFES